MAQLTAQEILIPYNNDLGGTLVRTSKGKIYIVFEDITTGQGFDDSPDLCEATPSAPNVKGGIYGYYTDTFGPNNDQFLGFYAFKSGTLSIEQVAGSKLIKDSTYGDYYEPTIKTNTYSGVNLLTQESKYGADFNLDGIIGDGVVDILGGGLCTTASGSLFWSPNDEAQGEGISPDAILITSDPKSLAALKASYQVSVDNGLELPAMRWVALGKDGTEDDVEIAVPIYKAIYNKQTQETTFALTSLSVYSIDTATNKITTSSMSTLRDIFLKELQYNTDFNNDGSVAFSTQLKYEAPEFVWGTSQGDDLSAVNQNIAFGFGGDDTLTSEDSPTDQAPPAVQIGGQGNDTYVVKRFASAIIYEAGGNSNNDVLDLSDWLDDSPNTTDTITGAIIDNKHLRLESVDNNGELLGGVLIIDYAGSTNKIEKIITENNSYTYTQAMAALTSVGLIKYTWEQATDGEISSGLINVAFDALGSIQNPFRTQT